MLAIKLPRKRVAVYADNSKKGMFSIGQIAKYKRKRLYVISFFKSKKTEFTISERVRLRINVIKM